MTIAPISFEFFPPKTTEGVEKLRETRLQLAKFKPEFFSVTFGAGGSTRDRTMETVLEIQQEGFSAAPHISCVSSSKAEIRALLQAYQAQGIKRLVTLRGDVPSGEVCVGDFRYALDLVEFIRAETGNHFHLEVAAYPEFHPEAKTPAADIFNLKRKIDAGANSAITQYFYNADAYFRFIDQCAAAGIDVPVFPVVQEEGDHAPVAGDIFKVGIFHQGIDTGPADKVPDKVILELEEGDLVEHETVLVQEAVHLRKQDPFSILFELLRCQDEDIDKVLVETLEEFILELRQGRFEEKILGLVRLFVERNIHQRQALFDPVLVEQFIPTRKLAAHKRAVLCKVVLII